MIAEASVKALNTSRDSGDATPPSDFLNMAYEVVDRHLEDGLGNAVAMRFLKRSDSPATIGDLYTYRRLASESNRFANVLAALAVQRGQTVFVLCPRVPALYVAVLGALKGGHA